MIVIFVILAQKQSLALNYKKSYFGSILSGQIANYNNDSSLSADFFNYAHTINPRNKEIYNLSLMSLVLDGNVKTAISTVKKYEEQFGTKTSSSVISNFLIFINEVKNNNFKKALQHLNNTKSFLITDKMIPILKGWLSESSRSNNSFRKI